MACPGFSPNDIHHVRHLPLVHTSIRYLAFASSRTETWQTRTPCDPRQGAPPFLRHLGLESHFLPFKKGLLRSRWVDNLEWLRKVPGNLPGYLAGRSVPEYNIAEGTQIHRRPIIAENKRLSAIWRFHGLLQHQQKLKNTALTRTVCSKQAGYRRQPHLLDDLP